MRRPPKLVALGGGTGLPRVLKASLKVGCISSAVVNVADDGGSSGELRKFFHTIPPGDIKNCLLASADNKQLAEVLNYRFKCECGLDNHSLGNLFLVALFNQFGDFKKGISEAKKILNTRADVIPVCYEPLTLKGKTADGEFITGQRNIANSLNISEVYLEPESAKADQKAVDEILGADMVTIGPGSLFSSILSTLLVPGIMEAINRSSAYTVFFCNTASFRNETLGFNVDQYLDAISKNVKSLKIDLFALNDYSSIDSTKLKEINAVKFDRRKLGIKYEVFDFAETNDPRYHSIEKLTSFLNKLIGERLH